MSQVKDFIDKINIMSAVAYTTMIFSLFNFIMATVLGVLLSYAIMERYNCNKYRSFMAIALSQTLFLPTVLSIFLKDIILYVYHI